MDVFEARELLFEDPEKALPVILDKNELEIIYLFGGVFRIAKRKIEQILKTDLQKLPKDVVYHPAGFLMDERELQTILKPHGLVVRKGTADLIFAEKKLRYVQNDFARRVIKKLALIDSSARRKEHIDDYFSMES